MTSEQLLHIISQICPECGGVNLNEDKTICWDCQAIDNEWNELVMQDIFS